MRKRWTLMYGMGRVRGAWHDHMRQIAQEEGIPDSYRPVVMFLHRNPGASQKSIADFLNVTTSAVNQVVKSMTGEGYLCKQPDPADRRSYKLYLTDQGEAVAARLRSRIDQADDAITAFVGPEQEAEMLQFLHELTDFIQKGMVEC